MWKKKTTTSALKENRFKWSKSQRMCVSVRRSLGGQEVRRVFNKQRSKTIEDEWKMPVTAREIRFVYKENRLWVLPGCEGQRLCVCVCVCAFVCPESFTEASAVCMRAAGQWMLSRNEWRPKQGRREADVREINIKPVNTNRHYLAAVLCMYASVMLLDVFFIFLWMNKGEDGVAACGAGVKSSQSLRMLMKQQIQRERGHVPTFP